MAKTKNPIELVIYKISAYGAMPGYITLGQRHLEKEKPEPLSSDSKAKEYIIPVDFLTLSTSKELTVDIEEVILGYQKQL